MILGKGVGVKGFALSGVAGDGVGGDVEPSGVSVGVKELVVIAGEE